MKTMHTNGSQLNDPKFANPFKYEVILIVSTLTEFSYNTGYQRLNQKTFKVERVAFQ